MVLFIFFSMLYADNYELRLYEKVLSELFQKSSVKVFVDSNTNLFQNSKVLKVVKSCKEADVLILYHPAMKCDRPLFVTSYKNYTKYQAIGAFYWRKGRPQLRLDKQQLKKFHLHLNSELRKYAR